MTTHEMFDGKLQLYKRPGGRFWQAAARVGGARFRETTKEEQLDRAKDVAEEWYLGLRGKLRNGEIVRDERTFKLAAEHYLRRALEEEIESGRRAPRHKLAATTRVFPAYSRSVFNDVLREEGLKFDRDGQVRTAYSLRHTYISTRLMEGANVHQIANNCRTSVKMIEEFYAAHIKDRLDAAAINVRRPSSSRKSSKTKPLRKPGNRGSDMDASV